MKRSNVLWFGLFVALIVLLSFAPNVWATPGQSPDRQTVPTRPRSTSQPPPVTSVPPSQPTSSSSSSQPPAPTSANIQPRSTDIPPPTATVFLPTTPATRGETAVATGTRTILPPPVGLTATRSATPTRETTPLTATPVASTVMPVALPTLVPIGEANVGLGDMPFFLGGGVVFLVLGLVLLFTRRKSA